MTDSMTIGVLRKAVAGFFDRKDDVPVVVKLPDGTLLELESFMYQQGPILMCAKETPPKTFKPFRVVK